MKAGNRGYPERFWESFGTAVTKPLTGPGAHKSRYG
jgi:hypothetical protein